MIDMVIINKQFNSTSKNYRGKKHYYISVNYHDPITQYKKSIVILDIKKDMHQNNINEIYISKIYSEHEQTCKTELSVKTANC